MLRFVVLAALARASAADWDAGTNRTCPRLWSACGGDATAWTGRLDASELLVMVVTGQATWKKRVGSMILPTWGRHVSASLVLLSDACGSDGTVPTVTLRLEGLPPGAWGVFPKQDRYAASKATGYELAHVADVANASARILAAAGLALPPEPWRRTCAEPWCANASWPACDRCLGE